MGPVANDRRKQHTLLGLDECRRYHIGKQAAHIMKRCRGTNTKYCL